MTPRASVAGRTAKEEEVFNAVRKYNEDLMRSKESGPDVAPPLPLKKKTSKYSLASIVHVPLQAGGLASLAPCCTRFVYFPSCRSSYIYPTYML